MKTSNMISLAVAGLLIIMMLTACGVKGDLVRPANIPAYENKDKKQPRTPDIPTISEQESYPN